MSIFAGHSMGAFGGLRVIVSEHAQESFRIFPDKKRTKRRMRRLRGKWGSEYRVRPMAYRTPHGLVCHPSIAAKLREAKP